MTLKFARSSAQSNPRRPITWAARAVVTTAAACSVAITGCEATRVAGPTIAFRNDATAPLTVNYWVGGRDTGDPDSGGSKLRKAATLEVGPGKRAETSLTPLWHYRSAEHTVVRAQVLVPESADIAGRGEFWFELGPPSPYSLRALATREADVVGIRFVRDGTGTFVTVPEQFWVKDNK
jgi:hypothetical protein